MGELNLHGRQVLLVDDYGHHPTELAATIAATRASWPSRRLVVLFQPHRYSRTQDLFDDFARVLSTVDVLLMKEVYPAGEQVIASADSKSLCRAIRLRGQIDPVFVENDAALQALLPNILVDGDVLLIMGAGDIGACSRDLHSQFGGDA